MQSTDLRRIVEAELAFERRIEQSKALSIFRRNPSTWELLLYLAQFEDGCEEGVYRTIENIETRYLGNSALLKFIRERRDDGLIVFAQQEKRSKRRLTLSAELRRELIELLEFRASYEPLIGSADVNGSARPANLGSENCGN